MSTASAPGCFPLSGLSGLHSSPGVVACAASLVCSGRGTAVIGSSGGEVDGEGLALSQPLLGRLLSLPRLWWSKYDCIYNTYALSGEAA